ncbi:MAG: class I SAM-dependent methyltransferase [bacterium]|nr:class I SAM-dependent methyltransferase [bacterium]
MDKIEKKEAEKYTKMWGYDSYRERSPGMRFLDLALRALAPKVGESIIDLGCGTGRTSNKLSDMGYKVTALDIASNACTEFNGDFIESSIWSIPDEAGLFDYGVCFDVMEHLPTEMVELSIECIAKHCKTVYFQIANFECHEGDKIGESLHLTVKGADWWADILKKHFKKVDVNVQTKHHLITCKN